MDSLTQIVLGAGVGELVLGKKLGNRAMLFGGIAGTIPDLDIIGNLFMSELDALAFHRGISHSLSFAIVLSLILAYLFNKSYKKKGEDTLKVVNSEEITYRNWVYFFFLTLFTHPILDCFTTYGTQLFAPFSNYRVAFCSISVVDPLYTIPFLICLIIVSFCKRSSRIRRKFTWIGLIVSSLYLLFTLCNKVRVEKILKETLKNEGIEYARIMTSPSILNNVLWTGTVDAGNVYYQGTYSFFDREKKFELTRIKKNDFSPKLIKNERALSVLTWFTNDYYSIEYEDEDKIRFNDIRYGKAYSKDNEEGIYVFSFLLSKKGNEYMLVDAQKGPPNDKRKEIISVMWERLKGIKN